MPDTIRLGGKTLPIAPVPGHLFRPHLPALQSSECTEAKIASLADIVFVAVSAADPAFTTSDLDHLPATLNELEVAIEAVVSLSHRTFQPLHVN